MSPSLVPAPTPVSSAQAHAEITALETELQREFLERSEIIRGTLVALLAGEHILLLGPPGTAKSTVSRALAVALNGTYFERLLTKFTVPEEVFGPLSLVKLQNDIYERNLDGYAVTADVVFLDECFKASSAILNAFLTLLNEREFDNGASRVKSPLQMCIGASNELPQDDSLYALWDRFMLRYWVNPIKAEQNFRALLASKGSPQIRTRLTPGTLDTLRAEVDQVILPPDIIDGIVTLKNDLNTNHGITVSDRRWVKVVKLAKASAVLNNRPTVTGNDMMVLAAGLWRTPDEASVILPVIAKMVSPSMARALELQDQAVELFGKIDLSVTGPQAVSAIAAANNELKKIAAEVKKLGPDVADIGDKVHQLQQTVAGDLARRLGLPTN